MPAPVSEGWSKVLLHHTPEHTELLEEYMAWSARNHTQSQLRHSINGCFARCNFCCKFFTSKHGLAEHHVQCKFECPLYTQVSLPTCRRNEGDGDQAPRDIFCPAGCVGARWPHATADRTPVWKHLILHTDGTLALKGLAKDYIRS